VIAVDSSAIVSLGLREPGWERIKEVLTTDKFAVGWPSVLESHIVLRAKGIDRAEVLMKDLLAMPTAAPIAFGPDHYIRAEIAYRRFGKGNGHPARLNFGDCMAYAVAQELDAPLLFKGDDFSKTDVDIHPASVFDQSGI